MSIDPTASSPETGERVHTVWNYYDGPREGIADFQGKPHLYKCQFSEANDDWTDLFWLMPIDEELLAIAREQHAIFLRWRAEFDQGHVPIKSHPALPVDRVRYNELQAALGDRLQLQPQRSITQRARFSNRSASEDAVVHWALP